MTCTTTVRVHACEPKVGSAGQLCNRCSESRALELKKHLREKHAEQKDLSKCAPLSKVSKAEVTNILKIRRIERARTEKQLKEVRSNLKEELVDASHVAHQKMNDLVDSAEKDSFTELFWEGQKTSFSRRPGGMRWHPIMVRFAILFRSQSPSTYRTLQEVDVLKLPAESTLKDYTNVLRPKSDFQMEVFIELKQMTETLKEKERWVCLLYDEIAIKSG